MAGIYNGPTRGGARGGRDQFKWEDIKNQPDKDYYLGASVKAVSGRWQKDKDVFWYTKEKSSGAARQDEIQAVKEKEQALMNQALGIPHSSTTIGSGNADRRRRRREEDDIERRNKKEGEKKKKKKRRHHDGEERDRRHRHHSHLSRRHRSRTLDVDKRGEKKRKSSD
mmetsp:Transcript_10703/g.21235  ORF Transcript_10703/g.21235 Transcript_10703/m.21235 type:complete len:168 (-) Transcript_10703:2175-2678(-)